MPATSCRHAALGLFLATSASAQISYKEAGHISVAQRALPGSGPGAAHANPAHLAEVRRFHALSAHFGATSGKADRYFYQLAATLPPSLGGGFPIALSAGFGTTWNDSKIDNSNAVYREALYSPGLALSWPAAGERTRFVALGLAFPIHHLNAFGAVKSISTGADLGILGVITPGRGRLAMGLAYRNLVAPDVDLPDARGTYELPGWVELAFDWTSPEGMFQLHYEQFFEEPVEKSEGPARQDGFTGVNGWSFEFRPVPIFGLKLERPRLGAFTSLGFAVHPEFSWGKFLVEFNVSHDRLGAPPPEWLFGEDQDEGRGYIHSLTVSADF